MLALWILGMAPGMWVGFVQAAPFIPADDNQVLERLRAPGDPQMRQLRRLRKALGQDPSNLKLAVQLARRYREIGRAEGDPRYYGYAQAALRPWWDQEKPPTDVLVLRAVLRQARHDFDGALEDLSQVLAIRPNNAQAWLTQAVILGVRGDHAGALRSCQALTKLTGALVAATCTGHAASLSGQAEESYHRLQQALETTPTASDPVRLWALTVLAEIATRLGRDEAAEQHFKQALSLGLRNTYLLGAYADFLLDRGRPEEVRNLLADETRTNALLMRLTLAEQRLNAPELREHLAILQARFDASRMRGEIVHRRDQAYFTLYLLNQPAEALRIAKENWQAQREPWDIRLTLEAALAADAPSEAAPVLNWLKESDLQDARIKSLVLLLEGTRN